jgi:hypothetical protein
VERTIYRQDEVVSQRVQINNTIWQRPRTFLEHRQSSQILCLTPQGQLALVIPQTVLFRPALFSSWGVRFLMRRSHVIYTQKIPCKKLKQRRKRPHQRSSAFDHNEVTTRGSASYPRVRHSAQKSPKGAAGLAQQVRKIEVFIKRLFVQKSPKGAAGLAQQVRKIEVFIKRLSVQKSPKGATGLAQQVRKIQVFPKRLSVQKSPKGAAGLALQVRKTEVFPKRLSVQKVA